MTNNYKRTNHEKNIVYKFDSNGMLHEASMLSTQVDAKT